MATPTLFTPGTADELAAFLTANEYPLTRGGNDLLIPGEYIVRQRTPTHLTAAQADQSKKWLANFLAGEKVAGFVRLPTKVKRKFLKLPKVTIQLVQLCHCCDWYLITINGSQTLMNALVGIEPGDDFDPRGADGDGLWATISPGDDFDPRGATLEIIDQNRYVSQQGSPVPLSKPGVSIREPEEIKTTPLLRNQDEVKANFGTLKNDQKAVKVAVIDTGFRLTNLPQGAPSVNIWHNEGASTICQIEDDWVGWNFIGTDKVSDLRQPGVNAIQLNAAGRWVNRFENNNPVDNNPSEHGTLLSSIITQTANRYLSEYKPEIMVLKAFDSAGIGTLFTIICAMCYAKAHGADVINASFVAPASRVIPVLEFCIYDLLQSKIIIVCAAGNRKSPEVTGREIGLTPGSTVRLYPACLSGKYKNVITVTTVWDKGNGYENYSKELVNVGLVANHPEQGNRGYFNAPYLWYRSSISSTTSQHLNEDRRRQPVPGIDRVGGSSFATAYFTGLVAAVMLNNRGIEHLASQSDDYRHALLNAIKEQNDRLNLSFPDGPNGIIQDNYYVQLP